MIFIRSILHWFSRKCCRRLQSWPPFPCEHSIAEQQANHLRICEVLNSKNTHRLTKCYCAARGGVWWILFIVRLQNNYNLRAKYLHPRKPIHDPAQDPRALLTKWIRRLQKTGCWANLDSKKTDKTFLIVLPHMAVTTDPKVALTPARPTLQPQQQKQHTIRKTTRPLLPSLLPVKEASK